jgi:hypothetical protein
VADQDYLEKAHFNTKVLIQVVALVVHLAVAVLVVAQVVLLALVRLVAQVERQVPLVVAQVARVAQ